MAGDPPARRSSALARFLSGARIVFEGIGLLRAQRGLWPLAAVPVLLSGLALIVAVVLLVSGASEIRSGVEGALPVVTVTHWYQWIWLGPLKLGLLLLECVAFMLIIALAALLALMLSNLASAPFLDRLSWRVERIALGEVLESSETGWSALRADLVSSVVAEGKRLLFFFSIWGVLVLAGFVIPGAQLLTGPLIMLVTLVLLPLQFSGYTLDRRRVSFKHRREWLRRDLPTSLGFGSVAFAACFVPVVNLLMIPGLVTAGTLLVVRNPPDSDL